MEENIIIEKESIESKILGIKAQINQMERMIEENNRMISLNDNIAGRMKMIETLTAYIAEEKNKLSELEQEKSEE